MKIISIHKTFLCGLNTIIWWGIAPFSNWEDKHRASGERRPAEFGTTTWDGMTLLFRVFGIRPYYVCTKHSLHCFGFWLRAWELQQIRSWITLSSQERGQTPVPHQYVWSESLGLPLVLSLKWGTTPLKKKIQHIHLSKEKIRSLRALCHVVHFATHWGSPPGSWNTVLFSSH